MFKRRLYTEERSSPLARWSLRLALFSVPVIVLAAALYRSGLMEFRPAVATLAAGLVLALLAGFLGIIAFIRIWDSGWLGMGKALGAIAIALAVLAAPAAVLARGAMLPRLTDVSTDTVDAPRYRALAFARPRLANPVDFDTARGGEQRAAYPGIRPVDLDATPEEAFNAVLAIIRKRHWHILDATPPRGAQRDGQIEAVAPTPLIGFRNDVVIRVRATAKGARVDMRSSSRYGIHDLGENAYRITSLLADLTAERRH